MKKNFLITLMSLWAVVCFGQTERKSIPIDFRYGSEVLYRAYGGNAQALAGIKTLTEQYRSRIGPDRGHLQIVSIIPESEKGNMAAINFASIRGAVVRQWLRDNFSWLNESDFTFFISPDGTRNAVEVSFVGASIEDKHQSDIFFSLDKGSPEKVNDAVARYERIPFLDGSAMIDRTVMDFGIIDPALGPVQPKKIEGAIDERIVITIYYRWDRDDLDKTYLTNAKTLHQIDSLLKLNSADYIDSIRIVAYASPEGQSDYNKRLSERRAVTLKNYILENYPKFKKEQIFTDARGENWDGFRRMAEADPKLPMKEQVLAILNNSNISDLQRQDQIAKLDGGRIYRNYILPNYYRYLRSGASLFVVYNPGMPVDFDFQPVQVVVFEPKPEPKPEPVVAVVQEFEPITKYPIAIRTNLLYNAIGAANIGVELPFGRMNNWSAIADFAYAYWRTRNHLRALQTLEYGAELRYWFGVAEWKKERNRNWAQPLKGWNVGAYGRYWQRYDVQWIDGYQGDGSWSAGLTAGYAFPIGRHLALEASVGGGWFSTSEYRHYHKPEKDDKGNYHLMWQETGKWSGFSLTKVRFSLVWLIQHTTKKGGQK